MSASWGRSVLVPARRIRPATDWVKVAGLVGAVVFSAVCWLGVGLLIWWAS